MTNQSVTLQLPEPIFRYLQQVASATQRPLEQVVRQSVEGNLPPAIPSVPSEMRNKLFTLQTMPVDQLLQVVVEQVSSPDQARHLELIEKNSTGNLTPAEQEELATLRLAADRLMIRRAYAWSVLRWRGVTTPSLDELPLE